MQYTDKEKDFLLAQIEEVLKVTDNNQAKVVLLNTKNYLRKEQKTMSIEHPAVTEMRNKGYVGNYEREQKEVVCLDYYDYEVYEGDKLVVFENGDRVLKRNLDTYLEEVQGTSFVTA